MRTALQFSGGRDSLALLLYMRSLWPHLTVVTVDTGDSTEYAKGVIAHVANTVPNFLMLKSDSIKFREEHGQPTGDNWTQCCSANLWMPMNHAIREHGFRQIIRGTKACDPYLHGAFPGDMVDGLLYTMPLWNWTDKMVDEYLGENLPDAYRQGAEAMPDCMSCPVIECGGTRTARLWKDAA